MTICTERQLCLSLLPFTVLEPT